MKFETKAIRLRMAETAEREHSSPLFLTSSFVFEEAEQMRALFAEEQKGNIYSRFSNPSCREFEQKMAALEGTENAISTATGMAAVYVSLAALLKQGDHVLASRAVFGSTYQLLTTYFKAFGISHTFVDPSHQEQWVDAIQPNTKVIFIETPSNPGLDIIDLAKTAELAKAHGAALLVDNCFATPYLQEPAKFGADLVIHSATKFIDGQGRVLGGVVCGTEELIDKIYRFNRNAGASLSPFNAWVLSKSLETLAVRMDRHCQNALTVAQALRGHPAIAQVRYPFLTGHPAEALARKQMSQGGALLTFELKGGLAAGRNFLDTLQLISMSANLGDTRTIATHPASTTHYRIPEAERLALGISDGLVRLSVGLEHTDDILADLLKALE